MSVPNAFSAINRKERLFLDPDGFVHPITNWLDSDGNECAAEDAVCAVAGSEGRWFSLVLSEYETGAAQ